MGWILGIVAAGLLAYAAVSHLEGAGGVPAVMKVGPDFNQVRSLADKWGRMFSVPVPMILTICHIESSFRPGVSNTSPAAMKRGGAWGVAQMTLLTAEGLVKQIQASSYASNTTVAPVLARWTGAGASLLDPDLCLLLAVWMLSGLWVKYKGNYQAVAAAYNQGSGTVDKVLSAGKNLATDLPPNGRDYVAKATAYWPTYQQYA